METYTYSEARQKLAQVLREAEATGKVLIRRRDGSTFALVPVEAPQSPLDVPSVKTDVSRAEIVAAVREGRRRKRRSRP